MSWSLLSSLAKRLEDQSRLFSDAENAQQRYLAISASSASIVFCLAAIYLALAIDPKRLVFRHQLIAFLLSFDLLKAVVLLLYPARIISSNESYLNRHFCQAVGFFTATAIEGADLAILAFAIHTFLLIFKPSLNVKFDNSDRVEGGLYRYRYYVYILSFLIPLALASFPYIKLGYSSFVCWCYLPQKPVWYRLVLSWVPRYVIIVTIFTVYLSIYVHVLHEFRTLGGVFTTMHRSRTKLQPSQSGKATRPTFFSAFYYFIADVCDRFLPHFILPESVKKATDSSSSSESTSNINEFPSKSENANPEEAHVDGNDAEFYAANLESFRKRQKIIEKQMKSIFVYPFAYLLAWLFPFILHCTQFNYEETHGPVVWLNYASAFAQPFIGFVDAMVFFYREEPWNYTIMKNYEKENKARLDQFMMRSVSQGDVDSTCTSGRLTRSSIGLSPSVDLSQYAMWRRVLSRLHFPFMSLPSESRIAKFHAVHIRRRTKPLIAAINKGEVPTFALEGQEFSCLQDKHDFSNLLDGSLVDNDFRQTLESYSLSFKDDERKRSIGSGNLSVGGGGGRRASIASASNKSNRSRRMSHLDERTAIPEKGVYVPGTGALARAGISSRRASIQPPVTPEVEDDSEMDFLEFLKRGP